MSDRTKEIVLDGYWQAGLDREYSLTVPVPGLMGDPREIDAGMVWYRREVALPAGDWTMATLVLNGARFCPSVYVNGDLVSETAGGMAPTQHLLWHSAVRPGETITLEIALQPLDGVPEEDASRIPEADWWRSNVSACLWNTVRLYLHGGARITRLVPWTDWDNDALVVKVGVDNAGGIVPDTLRVEVLDDAGQCVASVEMAAEVGECEAHVSLHGVCTPWTPDTPNVYTVRVSLLQGGKAVDQRSCAWGKKHFGIEGLGFVLNGQPVHLRADTVVWHRWCRDPEVRELAFDTDWFEHNIIQRLKEHGANTLRFHLGTPPEALLDLCDRAGLMVQLEWSFFHGIKASKESLVAQWRDWFDLAMRHPSVMLHHPWNESAGDEVRKAFGALEELTPDYPPLVIAHRDVTHVHKYWWSLFENLGLYYESIEPFGRPIMVDEFGGNYLGGELQPSSYPTMAGSLLRFLGPNHTPSQRLQLNTESNSQVAEYWRRLGAAGFSPFCALGSPEDGYHHFMGSLLDGNPKPVWDALTAAWAPRSVSLEVWDRNYTPGQHVELPLYWFNDTAEVVELVAEVRVVRELDLEPLATVRVSRQVAAFGLEHETVALTLPDVEGEWRLQAELLTAQPGVVHPVVSQWRVRTLVPLLPPELEGITVGVDARDAETSAFCQAMGLQTTAIGPHADVVLVSGALWSEINDSSDLNAALRQAVEAGIPAVLLNVGPQFLGEGYAEDPYMGSVDGAPRVPEPRSEQASVLGLALTFEELAEPESCLHPDAANASLWFNLDSQSGCLWNGLKGGLTTPAASMKPGGLKQEAFLAFWESQGADAQAIRAGHCVAYELAGQYAFAKEPSEQVQAELRQRVRFLVEDAPALEASIDPNGPVVLHDLGVLYRESRYGAAESITPLAACGRDLARTPIIAVELGAGHGRLVISQALTDHRLASGYEEPGLYGRRVDPVAQQMVFNMMRQALR